MVPLSLLALRNERVEMMKLELTKLTSAFIDDNSGPLLITGELIKGSKPNAKFNPSVVSISQLKEPNSSSLQTKTASSLQKKFPLDSFSTCPC